MSEIAHSLRRFVDENFLFGVEIHYADDDSLLEAGVLDSMGVLELITHLESTYGICVEDSELLPENLDSIDNLTRFIRRKGDSVPALA